MNNAVRLALTNYATFRGRTNRRDYWLFWLFAIIISISTNIIDAAFFANHASYISLESLSSIFLFIPSLAVGTRRMHDVGKRGWFLIIPLVNFYFLVQPSCPDNEFGPVQSSQTI